MKKQAGFGKENTRKALPHEKYIGKYVSITTMQGDGLAGKYAGISEEGNMIVNPHLSNQYSGGKYNRFLCNEDAEIKSGIVSKIMPTTKRNLEDMIIFFNNLERIEEMKRMKELGVPLSKSSGIFL